MYRRDTIELNELDPNNWNNILTKKNDTIHRLDKGDFLSEDIIMLVRSSIPPPFIDFLKIKRLGSNQKVSSKI